MTKNTGKVKFDSTPINLDVILNKKYIGKTPIDVVDIIPGVYEYNIKVDSNKIFTDRLIVYSNKTTYINKDFNLEIINPNENCINNNTLNLSILEELKKTNEQFKETNAQLIKINNNLISYEIRYYDESGTITYTTLIKPESTDSPFYDVKNINNSLSGRNAKVLNITNDGQGSMFVVISHDGMNFTEESPIYESDVKQYFDVNKVLLRGDRAGCKFRITEYPLTNVTANIQKSERIEYVSTDKDLHFTGALAMNYMETENLTGLLSNKIRIVAINGQSKQALKYRLIFWGSVNTLSTTNLDNDTFLTDVVMDFTDTLSTFQVDSGGGLVNQYYLDISALEALYEDSESSYTLHISLQNKSAVAKIAGAAGEVQFDIKYAMRL